jgi:cyclopropane-fatty-acyl-phospholipid synthase
MNSISNTIDLPAMPRRLRPLVKMFDRLAVGTLILTTPEGRQLQFGNGSAPRADLRLHSWQALRTILRNGDIGLAECYRKDMISTTRLTDLMRLALRNQEALREALLGNPLLRFGYRLRHLLRRNSRRGSSRNIQAHYDLGNDFYSLWLDSSMTYSSARFSDGDRTADLLHAQQDKYRRIIELSGAAAGDEILEIGCGWGGLAEYAATRNIRVRGVTLSPRQLAYARERLNRAGLGGLAAFELQDYRDLHGSYDHIVSIEMLEAVGENYWHTYFRKLRSLLRPGGRAAIQTIVIDDAHFERYRRRTDFIQQYIFPGGMLPSPGRLAALAEAHGFRIAQSESFGGDYAETLRRWRSRFDSSDKAIRELGFDDSFMKLWRFYLSYCEAGFDEQRIDVMMLQLVREEQE